MHEHSLRFVPDTVSGDRKRTCCGVDVWIGCLGDDLTRYQPPLMFSIFENAFQRLNLVGRSQRDYGRASRPRLLSPDCAVSVQLTPVIGSLGDPLQAQEEW